MGPLLVPNQSQILFPRWVFVEEEADETLYWLELLLEAKLVTQNQIQYLVTECNEILAMVVSSIKTARRNKND
ncbi:MAG: four helix bundle protein [Planctomycetota bacterium]